MKLSLTMFKGLCGQYICYYDMGCLSLIKKNGRGKQQKVIFVLYIQKIKYITIIRQS